MPHVVLSRDGAPEHRVALRDRDLRIGRSTESDIRLVDPNCTVSRLQGELRFEQGRWWFLDLQSQNGSWLNGERVQRVELQTGAEIAFGDYVLVFEPDPAAATAATDATVKAGTRSSDTLALPRGGSPLPPKPSRAPGGKAQQSLISRFFALPKPVVAMIVLTVILVTVLFTLAIRPEPVADEPNGGDAAGASESPPQASARAEASPQVLVPPAPLDPPANVTDALPAPESKPIEPSRVAVDPPPSAAGDVVPRAAPKTPRVPDVVDGVRRRENESPQAFQTRIESIRSRYGQMTDALQRGDLVDALQLGEVLLTDAPTFRDVPARVAATRAAAAEQAASAVRDGRLAEDRQDWSLALEAYSRALALSRSAPGAEDGVARVRQRMTVAGEDAYTRARQYDGMRRNAQAIEWFRKAAEWLPVGDGRRETARQRLAQLTGRTP